MEASIPLGSGINEAAMVGLPAGLPTFSDGEAVIQIPSMDSYEYLEMPVKTELPYSLENRIGDIGLGVDILDECELQANETLSPEEEERRKQRRERNKVAASKCRKKRKEHVKSLLQVSEELETQNNNLQEHIMKLQSEIKQLEFMLDSHSCSKHGANSAAPCSS